MLADWWAANRLEFVVWGIISVFLGIIWLLVSIAEIREERAQRRRDGLL